ncbi:MAG: protocatechuate 4,5-dioxygenase subunit alpha [Gammaproteobacteria bacterium]|nr:protocatechuate 4,5-dioxygenase subunit alpha [Gammaproteobacteria bacterium]
MKDYSDIPGTYVFDGEHSRKGYRLNMFCMSLNDAANRELFVRDESAYLDGRGLTPAQIKAVLGRDYLELLKLGGNIYYTFKLAMLDGKSMQYVGAQMSDMTEEAFREMMLNGGRPIDGNRHKGEF